MDKKTSRLRRALRTRMKIRELRMPRLCIMRTPRHMYAQLIAADGATVIAAASTVEGCLPESTAIKKVLAVCGSAQETTCA